MGKFCEHAAGDSWMECAEGAEAVEVEEVIIFLGYVDE